MIYTVTFNPSLDYIVRVDHFTPGIVNRTSQESILPGGKGINVSIVLQNLGMDNTALGFIAGFTGLEIRSQLKAHRISEQFITLPKGFSRINVKLRSNGESEINGLGPDIDSRSLTQFYKQLDDLTSDDILVLAGSIPSTLPSTVYRDIMEHLQNRKVMITVDAAGDLLCNVLELHPFLIKPNQMELSEIFGINDLQDKKEILSYAKQLQKRGARNVLVSMAGDGAVLAAEDGSIYESPAPKGQVINSVGAGDSMTAGFLYGYLTTRSYEQAFYTGIACGSASAFSENLAVKNDIARIFQQIHPKHKPFF